MKKTNLFIKLLAAMLVVCTATLLFASCNKKAETIALVYEGDNDKVYTITEEEFDILLKVRKRTFFANQLYTTSKDTATFWSTTSSEDEDKTNEEYYMGLAMDQVKAVLVEKYLFDICKDAKGNALAISSDTLDGYQSSLKSDVKSAGGQGAYKQYYGYTAKAYYTHYAPMVTRSDMIFEALTNPEKGSGELAATAENLKAYYEEHFVGYQYIVLDMKNKLVLDENGDPVRNKIKDEDGNEIDGDTYKTEEMTDAEKSEKESLPAEILKKIKDGVAFEELVQTYSEEYDSRKYADCWFLDKEATLLNSTVTDKVKDLKVGEWTGEAIKVGDKNYIVKRVELKPYVYEEFEKDAEGNVVKDENGKEVENIYFEVFEEFESTVNYDNYEKYIEELTKDVVVKEEVTGKYTMADTFLSPYVDDYYNFILQYYLGYQG